MKRVWMMVLVSGFAVSANAIPPKLTQGAKFGSPALGAGWFGAAEPRGEIRQRGIGEPDTGCAVAMPLRSSEASSGVLMRAQVRVCFRHVEVVDTPHGRVERRRTGWYALPLEVFRGGVQVGDYLYFEQETEEPTAGPLFVSVSHTPEPFCECILQAESVEEYAPGCARLHGVRLSDESREF